jgi:hypothetical protein
MRHKFGILLLLFSALHLLSAADRKTELDFSGYPPTLGFLRCLNLHTNAAQNLQGTNFLVITEFYRMDRVGGDMLRYIVTEAGQTSNYVDDGNGSAGDPHTKQLSDAAFKNLRTALERLPRTNQYPWLDLLVIISHRNGTNWVTHAYSRSRSPDDASESPALRQVLAIVGERPEAKEVHRF